MRGKLSVEMTREDLEALDLVAAQSGFSREAAAVYAVRLVAACIREGLLCGELAGAWPAQARHPGMKDGRILAFPAPRRVRRAPRSTKAREE